MVSPESIAVTLAIGSAPYQKTLASSLLSAGMLRRVIDFGPTLEIQDPTGDGALQTIKRFPIYRQVNRVLWGVWRRLPRKLRGYPPIIPSVWLADRLASRWITPSDIFHGYAGLSLASLRLAKQFGAITLIEQASRHPRHWRQSLLEESRRFGVDVLQSAAVFPEALIRRMERAYDACDFIVVPSAVAYDSFAERGYGQKTLMVRTGTDVGFFSPKVATERPAIFRACYIGRVELAKGIGYLLQAWKRLALPDSELLLVGEVKPEIASLLNSHGHPSIRAVGFASLADVARHYRESTLFIFPSANEGLAQVLLEAMASGLAVVASEKSGARECVTHGREGLIVPPRDVDALADAILWCYRHPEEVESMGKAARARIESEFTLEHYNQRIIALYRSLAESIPARHGGNVVAQELAR